MSLRKITQLIVSIGTAIVNQNPHVVYTSGKISHYFTVFFITDIIRFGYNLARKSEETQTYHVCLPKPIF